MSLWIIEKNNVKKSKKSFICNQCKNEIPKGTSYMIVKLNNGDGYWDTTRYHNECVNEYIKLKKAQRHNRKIQRDYIASIKYPKIKKLMPIYIYLSEKSEMRDILNKIKGIINEKT